MIQIIGLALLGTLIAAALKKYNPEQGYLLSLVVVFAILMIALPMINAVIGFCRELANAAGVDGELLGILLKALGISIIVRIAGELCRDAKEQGIAAALEIGGSALILYISLPLFSAIYTLILTML